MKLWVCYAQTKQILHQVYRLFANKIHEFYLEIYQKRAIVKLQRWWRRRMQAFLNVCAKNTPLRKVKFGDYDEDRQVFARLGRTIRNAMTISAVNLYDKKEFLAKECFV